MIRKVDGLRRLAVAGVAAASLGLALAPTALAADAAKAVPVAAATEGPTVSVVTATTGEVAEQIVVTGSLVPREELQVTTEIEGLGVSEILVEEGDRVTKGQVLARLNRDSLDVQKLQFVAQLAQSDAAIAQAQAQVAQAVATRTQTSHSLERTTALKDRGYATGAQYDTDTSAAAVAEAQLKSAQMAVEVASANKKATEAQRDQVLWRISRTDIRAPADGMIVVRNVRLGQVASAINPPLFRIIADGDIELEAEIPDISMPRLSKGMPVSVLPAGMTETVAGTVRLISPEIDKATRLGKVRVALKHDDRLAIGASARGMIEIGRHSGVTLPLSAVSYDKQGPYAQVVRDNVVHTQRLTVGLLGAQKAEITSGLVAGDLVIARAGTFVRDGDRVRPQATAIEEATQ